MGLNKDAKKDRGRETRHREGNVDERVGYRHDPRTDRAAGGKDRTAEEVNPPLHCRRPPIMQKTRGIDDNGF